MNRCLDGDTLVSLGAALDWDTDETLRHVVDCQSCQQQLRQLAELHRDLTEEIKPRPGFTDEVIQSIGVRRNRQPEVRDRLTLWGLLNPLMASVAVFFAIAYTSAGGPMRLEFLPAILVSLAGGAVTLWWNRTHPSFIVNLTR